MTLEELLKEISVRKHVGGPSRIERTKPTTDGCEAKDGLIYSSPALKVLASTKEANTDGAVMVFDSVITTSREDRDGDRLLTEGAEVDPNMPLLWQHDWRQPIGKFLGEKKRTKNKLVGSFAIADTPLGRDAAALVEMGALRMSHGFMPKEWEEIRSPKGEFIGYEISKLEIFEASLVSVPSNVDAVVVAYDRKKFMSEPVMAWAKSLKSQKAAEIESINRNTKRCAELVAETRRTIDAFLDRAKVAKELSISPESTAERLKTTIEMAAEILAKMSDPVPDLVILKHELETRYKAEIGELELLIDAARKVASADAIRKYLAGA